MEREGWAYLPVESVNAALDVVVDKTRVQDILHKVGVVMTVGDEHVVVKISRADTAASAFINSSHRREMFDVHRLSWVRLLSHNSKHA